MGHLSRLHALHQSTNPSIRHPATLWFRQLYLSVPNFSVGLFVTPASLPISPYHTTSHHILPYKAKKFFPRAHRRLHHPIAHHSTTPALLRSFCQPRQACIADGNCARRLTERWSTVSGPPPGPARPEGPLRGPSLRRARLKTDRTSLLRYARMERFGNRCWRCATARLSGDLH